MFFQVTSASISKQFQIPTVNTYYMPHKENDDSESEENKIVYAPTRIGYGLTSYSGEFSF
jgi:hypothetical protein